MLDTVWMCRDGRLLLVSQMETNHIVNCINRIHRCWPWRAEYLERLELELTIRTIRGR